MRRASRPSYQASEELSIIMIFDRHTANATVTKNAVVDSLRIGDNDDTPVARLGNA